MRRDMDLIRLLLLRLEEQSLDDPLTPAVIPTADLRPNEYYTAAETEAHLLMLYQAGFIDHGEAAASLYPGAWVFRSLTWQGQDFLDTVREDEVWSQTKEAAKKVGGFSVAIIAELAKAIIKAKAASLGLSI